MNNETCGVLVILLLTGIEMMSTALLCKCIVANLAYWYRQSLMTAMLRIVKCCEHCYCDVSGMIVRLLFITVPIIIGVVMTMRHCRAYQMILLLNIHDKRIINIEY